MPEAQRIFFRPPEADYENVKDGKVYGGDELMEAGITVSLVKEDFHAFTFRGFFRMTLYNLQPGP